MLDRKSFIINMAMAAAALRLQSQCTYIEKTKFSALRPPLAQRKFISKAVDAEIDKVKAKIAHPELAWLFENCFPNTLDTTITHHGDLNGKPDTFVITGDINAMWLRDSSAQIYPYVPYIVQDNDLKRLVQGVINRHARSVLIDPYANAFNYDGSKWSQWASDHTDMKIEVFERKWEVDSLCYVIRLAHKYWKVSGDTSIFDAEWVAAMNKIVATFREQQRKSNPGPYHFRRGIGSHNDNPANKGYGAPSKSIGLLHSMFRPSDDATKYPFLIPSNFFAVISLKHLAEIAKAINNETLAKESLDLSEEVLTAIKEHATYDHPKHGKIYAYEIDGLGNQLIIDEPNLPNLLTLTYFESLDKNDPVYQNTRKMILSESNPYFIKGKYAEGVGSDHTPKGYIWHLSLIARALTSDDDAQIIYCLKTIKATHAHMGFMHEGFDANNPSHFTRKWFAWANTIFGELILKVYNEKPHLLSSDLI